MKNFYILLAGVDSESWKEVKGKYVDFPLGPRIAKYKWFVAKFDVTYGKWGVFEESTGMAAAFGKTKKEAEERAMFTLETNIDTIDNTIIFALDSLWKKGLVKTSSGLAPSSPKSYTEKVLTKTNPASKEKKLNKLIFIAKMIRNKMDNAKTDKEYTEAKREYEAIKEKHRLLMFSENPASSERQRKFMCAELGRKKSGKRTVTGMTKKQLKDFCRKDNPAKYKKSFYVAWSSVFDTKPYDVIKIKEAVEKAGGTNIRMEPQFGFSNQPNVVVFDLSVSRGAEDAYMRVVGQAVEKSLGTEWIMIRNKSWRTKGVKSNPKSVIGGKRKEEVLGGKRKWYIGISSKGVHRIFATKLPVTRHYYPEFAKVVGPFSSEKAAKNYNKG